MGFDSDFYYFNIRYSKQENMKVIDNVFTLFLLVMAVSGFTACNGVMDKKSLSPEKQSEYLNKGKAIAELSTKALSAEVMKAIQEGGTAHAVDYCHLKASPLIDSLSVLNNAGIYRVSDKNRSPENKAGELDITVMQAYRDQLNEGRGLQPHLEVTDREIVFYSPILIATPACLLCHGDPGSNIDPETAGLIKSRYPADLATGYKLGDLRGMWKIVFEEKSMVD